MNRIEIKKLNPCDDKQNILKKYRYTYEDLKYHVLKMVSEFNHNQSDYLVKKIDDNIYLIVVKPNKVAKFEDLKITNPNKHCIVQFVVKKGKEYESQATHYFNI